MIFDDQHHDVIVIGSGAGGGSLAGALAAKGRSVLLLERGGAMDLADQNVASVDLFRENRYHPGEAWFGPDGDPFNPQTIYALGGNTKIWGGVLERMWPREFEGLPLQEGVAPAWPLTYGELAPWYERAEALYRVHGRGGLDPNEPPRSGPYPHQPLPLDPLFEHLRQGLERQGSHPYDLPLSWSEVVEDPSGDAELFGVQPALEYPGTRLISNARVTQLHVDPSGREVKGVEAEIAGQLWLFRGDQVVLAAGAVNTPALLLRSRSELHPDGLANGSGQVGRNLMKPQLTAILQLARETHGGCFPRSLGVNDYVWGDQNVSFPLGHIETGGGVLQDAQFAESPPVLSLVTRLLPNAALEQLAVRSICWWAMSPVLPDPDNRIELRGERLSIQYLANNLEAHDRLVYRWLSVLKTVDADPLTPQVRPAPFYPRGEAPLAVIGHACGTCRMGDDPAFSVVDRDGRVHGLVNLTIADASVFPSCPMVSPGLTVIANALRIAERL
ncbi:GMC family oxidoreductase [Synechococcus sp. Cruz-9H2]|uniref:GMC oxidoreductase n=1 Tax=unclassified Synechococcus TaxID=2626047 RepID=UPI0020CE473D|nr:MULTISPECIES: GMC family oxidoreductase [unclassified Synechococcus]MCP9817903.1 GMC family oxidoreductase [Synechococcus sp. Cruz-9H2]MCP9842597.1 GMC family oxidoreductase [Synechococcus sp. Edmonson 11F2]MCP9854299.1 GMC family oxidoreductase [Synechococcus sp. Cruz-9C9]MCP9862005.1 GMC family oxidoreductase [Synechococcus sp. Cruz-7E5]MCP9868811.1 GMC family oxidoreductase [Synechococcus sp. Cruz-7B9]